jgi:hypothetical protein
MFISPRLLLVRVQAFSLALLAANPFPVKSYSAFVTRPERMQRVQTLMVATVPFCTAFTFWRFGYQVLDVLLFAWLTLLPKLGPFPQIEHILDIFLSSFVD